MNEVTRILDAIGQGDACASAQLLPLVYDELRRLAAQRMAQEKPGQTLQPTALVHEAYLRLVGSGEERHWDNRGHFFAAAAEAMRRILVENARRKRSLKRGGDRQRLDLNLEQPVEVERTAPLPGARRSPGSARSSRRRQGKARETPLLRRHDDRTGGRNAGHLGHHREPLVELRPRLAARGDPPRPGYHSRSRPLKLRPESGVEFFSI